MTNVEKIKVQKFKDILFNIANLIDNCGIEVRTYSETGTQRGLTRVFRTNRGQIALETKFGDTEDFEKESCYTIGFNSDTATVMVKSVRNEEPERMFDDIGEDLKSLFYNTHFDSNDKVEYEDMSGEEEDM